MHQNGGLNTILGSFWGASYRFYLQSCNKSKQQASRVSVLNFGAQPRYYERSKMRQIQPQPPQARSRAPSSCKTLSKTSQNELEPTPNVIAATVQTRPKNLSNTSQNAPEASPKSTSCNRSYLPDTSRNDPKPNSCHRYYGPDTSQNPLQDVHHHPSPSRPHPRARFQPGPRAPRAKCTETPTKTTLR